MTTRRRCRGSTRAKAEGACGVCTVTVLADALQIAALCKVTGKVVDSAGAVANAEVVALDESVTGFGLGSSTAWSGKTGSVSVSAKLRAMVGWVLGEDLSAPDVQPGQEARAPAPPKVQQRRSEGDGFDDTRPAPARAASAPRVEVSPLAAESSAELLAAATDFVASLDDLQDLAGQAAEPEPEFVPEGGMSTQSLMREFEELAPELQAAAAELAAEAAATHGSTEALISEVDALLVPAPPPSLESAAPPAPSAEPSPPASPDGGVSAAPLAPALLEAAHVSSPESEVSAAPLGPSPLEAAATHSSTEALISVVDALLVPAPPAPPLESAPPASVSEPAAKVSGPEGAGVG